jgi:mitofilin
LPHVEAMKTPLHESVLNDVAYKAVGLGKWKIVTADAPRKYRAPPKMSGAAPRGLPHASAAKFPLHASVLAEQRAAAQARADAIKGHVEVQPVVPPPPAAEVGASQAAATTLREPLSKPKSGATSAVPAAAASSSSSSSAGGGHEEQQSASRTPFLAAAGAVLVAYLAYAMGADDPEDLPPPPRRSKPKSKAPAARRDVEVEVQIVKQPEENDLGSASKGTRAANAATASSSAAEKEKEEAKKELDDAFSAAAEFLANAEVSACFFLVSF